MSEQDDDDWYDQKMQERISDLEAENKLFKELLEEFLEIHGECNHDHHGYCQTHFLEENCLIERTQEVLS